MARRTREHVIADLAVNFVERQILLAGATPQRMAFDYGVDLSVSTFAEDGEAETGYFHIQVKSTEKLLTVKNGTLVRCRVWQHHLRRWLSEPMPVIVVVYDAGNDKAYWLHVQGAFPHATRFRLGTGTAQLSLHLPTSQEFTAAAVLAIRKLKQSEIERVEREI